MRKILALSTALLFAIGTAGTSLAASKNGNGGPQGGGPGASGTGDKASNKASFKPGPGPGNGGPQGGGPGKSGTGDRNGR